MTRIIYILLVFFPFLQSCSAPEAIEVQFNRDSDEVFTELLALGNFEEVGLESSEKSIGDVNRSFLNLYFTMTSYYEQEIIDYYKIGGNAMGIIFESIENEKDFDLYYVYFLKPKAAEGDEAEIAFTVNINYSDAIDYYSK